VKAAVFAPEVSARRGVTLLELIIVCVIVAIVTVVTVPVFDRLALSASGQSKPSRIEDQLNRCRESAIAHGASVRLAIDSSSLTSWTAVRTEDGLDWKGPTAVDSAVVLTSSRAEFTCYPAGSMQGPALFVRHGGALEPVVIDALAGRFSTR